MVKEIRYTSITRVLDDLTEHPLLRDLTLEQVVRHTIRFIGLHGYSKLYCDKIEDVEIKDFRGLLPCDLISIIQVKDKRTGICLRHMTDNFAEGMEEDRLKEKTFQHQRCNEMGERDKRDGRRERHGHRFDLRGIYIPPMHVYHHEPAFKTQGRVIFTSFPEGCVEIAYKAIPIDKDGFPLLIDNENYLAALEAYIKKMVFTVKFDTGKVSGAVLQNAQTDYAFLAAELNAEMTMPSTSEMESITRYINTMIPKVREFDNGFVNLGNREYIRNH